jgi:hypothetical protein
MKQALLMVRYLRKGWIEDAHKYLVQGEKALESGETPVGCVLVHNDKIVGAGMNDTNKSMNVRRGSRVETSTLGASQIFLSCSYNED